MSNIDKLKAAAAKAVDNFDPNMFVETRDVLALLDELEAKDKRIAELEAKLETADKLQDSSFRHGLQHGFSLGQTDNQAGFEQAIHAYGQQWKGE
ncbi:hypothetical protein H8V75_11940 [Enterobacter roggenkampii]|uniref:ead/Ea22-like family protein n=1 Tax=Enterobacter roggenkampii TaxID=1812935 RepID=UPI001E5BF52D|nr:ead/Ea22-like family protein [Enterobacter roggenkampii]MCC7579637.1 hypothetical protein [Enterobacter roggenkampii]MCC7588964.1 hypothetical protein [Enterobacter roggenkampii]MCC7593561.1 hypothetical protein [Enterobacter roggenkampii]MCC7603085.1 hypothetical protein [Enterobacter roggenkampii]MCC7608267.1 hypothetical protein [Enterobacter roggenkampii]